MRTESFCSSTAESTVMCRLRDLSLCFRDRHTAIQRAVHCICWRLVTINDAIIESDWYSENRWRCHKDWCNIWWSRSWQSSRNNAQPMRDPRVTSQSHVHRPILLSNQSQSSTKSTRPPRIIDRVDPFGANSTLANSGGHSVVDWTTHANWLPDVYEDSCRPAVLDGSHAICRRTTKPRNFTDANSILSIAFNFGKYLTYFGGCIPNFPTAALAAAPRVNQPCSTWKVLHNKFPTDRCTDFGLVVTHPLSARIADRQTDRWGWVVGGEWVR